MKLNKSHTEQLQAFPRLYKPTRLNTIMTKPNLHNSVKSM
jgi:hypothetical protein